MTPVALALRPVRGGWAIQLTNGREIARFTGLGARHRAVRYLTRHEIASGISRRY
jgi:hypothetical protein